jgi:hypothetical protein
MASCADNRSAAETACAERSLEGKPQAGKAGRRQVWRRFYPNQKRTGFMNGGYGGPNSAQETPRSANETLQAHRWGEDLRASPFVHGFVFKNFFSGRARRSRPHRKATAASSKPSYRARHGCGRRGRRSRHGVRGDQPKVGRVRQARRDLVGFRNLPLRMEKPRWLEARSPMAVR